MHRLFLTRCCHIQPGFSHVLMAYPHQNMGEALQLIALFGFACNSRPSQREALATTSMVARRDQCRGRDIGTWPVDVGVHPSAIGFSPTGAGIGLPDSGMSDAHGEVAAVQCARSHGRSQMAIGHQCLG